MDFSEALKELKNNHRVCRAGWNGQRQYVRLYSPVAHGMEQLIFAEDNGTKPLLPFLILKNADDKYVPWLASQGDLLAEDWELF